MIKVKKMNDTTFDVTVESEATTTHTVSVDPAYHRKLAGDGVTAETLVEKSFEFLLERESNTSILSSFDLPIIGRYFPEYETKIRGMLK